MYLTLPVSWTRHIDWIHVCPCLPFFSLSLLHTRHDNPYIAQLAPSPLRDLKTFQSLERKKKKKKNTVNRIAIATHLFLLKVFEMNFDIRTVTRAVSNSVRATCVSPKLWLREWFRYFSFQLCEGVSFARHSSVAEKQVYIFRFKWFIFIITSPKNEHSVVTTNLLFCSQFEEIEGI